jgi:phage protein D
VQQATDLRYLTELAARHAYVFYVIPGPVIGTNTAYWGPPVRIGIPQRALTVDMGPATNVESVNFENSAVEAVTVEGSVQDRRSNQRIPVMTFLSTRPPLAINSPLLSPQTRRLERFRAESGQDAGQAMAQAQARTDASMDTVKVEGELNSAKYGAPLRARGLVGLRGVGFSYDGLYYVKQVTHQLKQGEYRQKFTLTREGTGSTVPVVVP